MNCQLTHAKIFTFLSIIISAIEEGNPSLIQWRNLEFFEGGGELVNPSIFSGIFKNGEQGS
jgi:hypothetical protein